MKAYIITLPEIPMVWAAAERCKASTDHPINMFPAVTPENVDEIMKANSLVWTYPWEQEKIDLKSGLKLSPYTTAEPKKRIACFLSHFLLWKRAILEGPLLILEQDSIFTRRTTFDDYQHILDSKFGIVSINDPRGATRMAHEYHDKVQNADTEIAMVPTIDDITVPQGLPGNSAYIIKPEAAKTMIELSYEYGCWPNDALMCKQNIPNLGVNKTYFTRVQGLPSTTTL